MIFWVLGRSDVGHLYRHDVEAFYCVLLILCCHYENCSIRRRSVHEGIEIEKGDAFCYVVHHGGHLLRRKKLVSWFVPKAIPTSTSFSAFRPWLVNNIRYAFKAGLHARSLAYLRLNFPRRKQFLSNASHQKSDIAQTATVTLKAWSPLMTRRLVTTLSTRTFWHLCQGIDSQPLVIKKVEV
ncbi:uncharacterized protein BT62DRAFT_479549 [Guyanagaster necrorhizus]|uniref:Uncharacterized protein n=1 Tax=Guyanagaster necrorhizus TaxID=856835 RepID=A0A9P7VJ17_9AGAR|nr:uncharacterized protein BT62DRAFT_479549 [Guyanagaster necrorhizus MCA 3950]KAG7441473.1 hypothetical protein BT62DRAFT_479549 [Guyanagaster necrorhizus MCA 3950]